MGFKYELIDVFGSIMPRIMIRASRVLLNGVESNFSLIAQTKAARESKSGHREIRFIKTEEEEEKEE